MLVNKRWHPHSIISPLLKDNKKNERVSLKDEEEEDWLECNTEEIISDSTSQVKLSAIIWRRRNVEITMVA